MRAGEAGEPEVPRIRRRSDQQLVAMTAKFCGAYKAGKDDRGTGPLPVARMHWERIETVAESFGDLDPKLDLREADLEARSKWTGWHPA
jgi:iron uptake system component EfeO